MLGWPLSKKTQKITSVGKDEIEIEEIETLCTVGGNVKWCSHYGKQPGVFENVLNIEKYHMIQ